MTILLYFILGIMFYGLIMPILESIVSVICTRLEVSKGKMSLSLMKMQEQMEEKETTHAIGFDTTCATTLEDDEDEDWEDE